MAKISIDDISRAPWRCLYALCLFACNPGPDANTSEGSASTTSVTTTSETSGSSGAPTTGGSETAAVAICGDAEVDPDEACDDGNDINGDGCNRDCQPSGVQLAEYRAKGSSWITSIAPDPDGTLVLGGYWAGSGWVARFDGALTPQWTQNFEEKPSLVRAVARTDGAIYVAGSEFSDVDSHDLWVASLDPDGVVVWEDTISGGKGDDWATQVDVVDGDLVVTGMVFSDQLWTRRYGADGAAKWTVSQPLGNTYKNIYPLGAGMAVSAGAVITGWAVWEDDGNHQTLFALAPADGAPVWTVESDTVGVYFAIAIDSGGDLALVSSPFTVARTTAAGAPIWTSSKCVGDSGRDVAIDSQGDIVVIGDGSAPGGRNIRLCKFSPEGVLRWGKDIDGGAGDDLGYAVAIDASDRVIAGGQVYVGKDDRRAWLAVFSP